MKTYRWLSTDKITYLLYKIKELFYTKEEVDKKIGHSAQAYYYPDDWWAENDIILAPGELGISATSGFMKIGDGIHKWSEMDYAIFPVSLAQRNDNLLLKENEQDLFLSEGKMRKLILDVIYEYHGDKDIREFITDDGFTLITADGYEFIQAKRITEGGSI